MIVNHDDWVRKVKQAFERPLTVEEDDAIWDAMVRDGIIDNDGKVLVRMPEELPEWAKPANGHATIAEPKKPKRRRKTT